MSHAVSESVSDVFLQPPTDDPNTPLLPTRVVSQEEAIWTVATTEPETTLEVGANATAYYTIDKEFVKQPCTVQSVETTEGEEGETITTLIMELHGDPVSAEKRQSFRVSCAGCAITASLGEESGCMVVDVSATGFGLYAHQELRIGDIVHAQLHYQGETHDGQVAVQSIRKMPGHKRYGMTVVDGSTRSALIRALPKVNAAIQREQLRRLA
ncbi:MAG: PilZ domain-containing protein [Myxococcales bacterium]|nr:PilZ domain-containing protein [Myxococcales bacterium]